MENVLKDEMLPAAVVMNMFYTGLGIARSLGERGIPVLGLTAQGHVAGSRTRYAKKVICPDSREEPEALFEFLCRMGEQRRDRAVLFPTRDHDILFLNRYREGLSRYFALVIPEGSVIAACLDKWKTFQWAQRAGVAAPRSWAVEGKDELLRVAADLAYPCVLKPIAAHHWRTSGNWEAVSGRKAIKVASFEELLREYSRIAHSEPRALLQEMIPGNDDDLFVAACYLDRESRFVAGFAAQKLVQVPEGFGTGCIVQSVERPELLARTVSLLQEGGFTGIAEVEYKRDPRSGEYVLIEINPRPWDQHRLGYDCGADLIYLAYCEQAGLPTPALEPRRLERKWIAEDAFLMAALQFLWRRDPRLRRLLQMARGKRMYGIWSRKDPLPWVYFLGAHFLPGMVRSAAKAFWSSVKRKLQGRFVLREGRTAL